MSEYLGAIKDRTNTKIFKGVFVMANPGVKSKENINVNLVNRL